MKYIMFTSFVVNLFFLIIVTQATRSVIRKRKMRFKTNKIKPSRESAFSSLVPSKFNIVALARLHGWEELSSKDSRMVSFKRKGVRVNVYYTTMTVATSLDHPTKGKTQLYRKKVSMLMMDELFKNPRVHTGKGYYIKKRHGEKSKKLHRGSKNQKKIPTESCKKPQGKKNKKS